MRILLPDGSTVAAEDTQEYEDLLAAESLYWADDEEEEGDWDDWEGVF